MRESLDPPVDWENVFAVPGNHDVNWDQVGRADELLIDSLKDPSDVQQLIHDFTRSNSVRSGSPKYPVTNRQYSRFLEETGGKPPRSWEQSEWNQPEQPVVGVDWYAARAYCEWAGLVLPTEAQWEAAARGGDGRRYPWGNESPSDERANYNQREGRTTSVGAYPAGAGPFGTLDQAGNVWEWCADGFDPEAYQNREGSVDPVVDPGKEAAVVVLRGGSWLGPALFLAAAFRYRLPARSRSRSFGFRCALAAVPERGTAL